LLKGNAGIADNGELSDLAGYRKKWMKVAEKNAKAGAPDIVAANIRLDSQRRRCKVGVADGPFNANGNIGRPSGESRVIKSIQTCVAAREKK
jgi:hypothetical protein